MSDSKMHADEVDTSADLVRRLIAAQMPQWSDEPVRSLASAGTDNAIFRLGADKVVRLPRMASADARIRKELTWLPRLAPHLPLTVPTPLGSGQPGEGYPFPWSVFQWIDGVNATDTTLTDLTAAAASLAAFIRALQAIDTSDGPPPGDHNFGRGVPLIERDAMTRECIAQCEGMINTKLALAIWEDALKLPAWDKPPVWIHGDLQSGNLLAQDGTLAAVIDFGGLGVGDPACDLQVAWNLFSSGAIRGRFRTFLNIHLNIDEATWLRGRAWALSVAVIALPYYKETNPTLAEISRRTIRAVLTDMS